MPDFRRTGWLLRLSYVFKRHFDTMFLAMARPARVRSGAQALASGGRVIAAQLAAGYDSGSGFRAALARLR